MIPAALAARMDQQQHAAGTRDTYAAILERLGALTAGPEEAQTIIDAAVAAAQGKSLGTVLPLRAAVSHWLISVAGWSAHEADAFLPAARGTTSYQRRGLSRPDLDRFYAAIETLPYGAVRVILDLLPRTGTRISEMCSLRTESFKLVQGVPVIAVLGKGSKERIVHMSRSGAEILQKWLDTRTVSGPWMFPGYKTHLTPDAVRFVVRKISTGEIGGTPIPDLTPHVLRHTWATGALRSGVDLKRVQEELGHNNLATTSRYLHTDDSAAQADMDRAEQWK